MIALTPSAYIAAGLVAATAIYAGILKIENATLESDLSAQTAQTVIANERAQTASAARTNCESALEQTQAASGQLIEAARIAADQAGARARAAHLAAERERRLAAEAVRLGARTGERIERVTRLLTIQITASPPADHECARTEAILNSLL